MAVEKKSERWLPVFLDFIKLLRIDSKEVAAVDDKGSPLKLWGSQKRFLEAVCHGLDTNKRVFYCLKSRQVGLTTLSLVIDVFWLAMHPATIGALVTDTPKNSAANRRAIRRYVESVPRGFFGKSFTILDDNRDSITFSNGSRLDLLVAGTRTKKTWGEGQGYVFAHLTEVANYGSKEGLDSFREALSSSNPNRLAIYESTAKGFNHFRDLWIAAKKDPHTCVTVFVGWWSKDLNVIKKTDPRYVAYNADPTSEEQELIDAVEELYNYKVTMEQLAWYRWRATQDDVDINTLYQNQPWCVTAETRVGTSKGILKIKDVPTGEEGTLGKILASGPTGRATIWCATTSLGYKIRGTGNHPLIMTDGAQVDLSESIGKKIKLQPPRFGTEEKIVKWRDGVIECGVRITPQFARFVGLFMGDGHLSGHNNGRGTAQSFQFSIACTGRDRDIADECHRLLKELFGITAQEKHDYKDGVQGGCITVRCGSRLLWETFTKLGLLRTDTGQTQRKVHVPDFIWESPREVVREFLSGLFEADGFNDYKSPRVVFSTKYPKFAQEVQLLLLSFEITSKVRQCTPKIGVKIYSAMNLAMRTTESIKFNQDIGFLSGRKKGKFKLPPVRGRGWKHRIAPPIVLEDTIVSVVNEGVEEEVYNLTIAGDHLFDANGILTHNTEGQSFVMSGFSFFATRMLQTDMARIQDPDDPISFKGYRYLLGNEFQAGIMEPINDMERIDEVRLRVWEDPVPGGTYVIGCDPAWGRNDWADRTSISVWRCFADRLIQVAEYADSDVDTRQAAWVLAHLAGAYSNCIINIELTGGPGMAVMTEFDHLKDRMRSDMYREKVRKDFEWDDFLNTARWYLYHKPDSIGAGYAKGWMSSHDAKWRMMCSLKDSHTSGLMITRSVGLVEEMLTVVQDGSDISAPGRAKDDRVFAAGLANMGWVEWARPNMIAQGLSYDVIMRQENEEEKSKGASIIDQIVMNFMKKQETYEEPLTARQEWLRDRGFS